MATARLRTPVPWPRGFGKAFLSSPGRVNVECGQKMSATASSPTCSRGLPTGTTGPRLDPPPCLSVWNNPTSCPTAHNTHAALHQSETGQPSFSLSLCLFFFHPLDIPSQGSRKRGTQGLSTDLYTLVPKAVCNWGKIAIIG